MAQRNRPPELGSPELLEAQLETKQQGTEPEACPQLRVFFRRAPSLRDVPPTDTGRVRDLKRRRRIRQTYAVFLAVLVVWSMRGTGFAPGTLVRGATEDQTKEFLTSFLHPDLSAGYLREVGRALVETLQISVAALAVGVVLAIPMTPLAASNLASRVPGLSAWRRLAAYLPYQLARNALNFMRAVPELIWALVFITAVGLGPLAGALAIGVHAAGLLGKLWSEQLEAVDPGPVEAIRLLGGGRLGILTLGLWPMARQDLLSLTLYQWECNLRAATIVGFVGAGGIGQQIDISIRLFRYSQTSTLIIALLVVVFLSDSMSAVVRRLLR